MKGSTDSRGQCSSNVGGKAGDALDLFEVAGDVHGDRNQDQGVR